MEAFNLVPLASFSEDGVILYWFSGIERTNEWSR